MNEVLRKHVERCANFPFVTSVAALIATALLMTLWETANASLFVHKTPATLNWPTIMFTSLLSMLLTFILANLFRRSYEKIEELDLLHQAGMTASLHYLGNAITTFQLIEIEVETSGTISEHTLAMIRKELLGTERALKDLSALENPDPEKILSYLRTDVKARCEEMLNKQS